MVRYNPTHFYAFLTMSQKSEWEIRLSNSRGVPYFFNVNTKQSSWEPPSSLSKEDIESLPGAKEYLIGSIKSGTSGSGATTGQVRASHLLVKHRGSRRPSSWKDVSIDLYTPRYCVF